MDCWGASTQRGPMYSPQGANQAIDEFSAAKTERFNLSTTVQKSVQLALQNRGQGAFSCPHLRSQENLSASPYGTSELIHIPIYGARELVHIPIYGARELVHFPLRSRGTCPCPHYRALDGDRELVHVPEAIAIGHYILISRTQNV